MSGAVEARMAELGMTLPRTAPSRAMFLPGRITGNLLILSGQICEWEGVPKTFGPVGEGFDMAAGQAAARLCALNLLFSIRAVAGSLDRVAQVVRLGGFVAAPPGYPDGPQIVDGASRVFVDLWGEAGRHARTAVNVASLPANALVEVEAMVELR